MRKDLRKTITEDLIISESDKVSFPNLISVSYDIHLYKNAKAKFPVLETSGKIHLHKNAKAEFPVLKTSGDICLHKSKKIREKLNIEKMSVGMYHLTVKNEPATYLITDNKKSVRIEKI